MIGAWLSVINPEAIVFALCANVWLPTVKDSPTCLNTPADSKSCWICTFNRSSSLALITFPKLSVLISPCGNSIFWISDQSDSKGFAGNPASETDLIINSTTSPGLIDISKELKFTALASSSLSRIQPYFPVASIALFLTGPLTSTQFEKAAVFSVWFVASTNFIWSTVEVFPEVETYLYLILNCTTSCDTWFPIFLGSGTAQNPLTLYFGAAVCKSADSAEDLISLTTDEKSFDSESLWETNELNSFLWVSLSAWEANFLVLIKDFFCLIDSSSCFNDCSVDDLSDFNCLILSVVVLSVKCLLIWTTLKFSTLITGGVGIIPDAAGGI